MEFSGDLDTTAAASAKAAEVRTAEKKKKKLKVMVAVDASDGSLYALSWALDHLFVTSGRAPVTAEELGTLIVLHAQQPFHGTFFPAGQAAYASGVTVLDSVKKAQEQNSANVLSRALQICKDKLVKAESVVMEGDPKDIICEAAEKMQVDILVVGSRGLGMLKRAFIGSVSDYVAHHAKCPVLIVKPPKGISSTAHV